MRFTIGQGLAARSGLAVAGTGSRIGTGSGTNGSRTSVSLTAIGLEGWLATHTDIAAFQPSKGFTVRRPDFDGVGQPATVIEELSTTTRMRLP